MTEPEKFGEGDVVALASKTEQLMTVEGVSKPYHSVSVVWFDEHNKLQRDTMLPGALVMRKKNKD